MKSPAEISRAGICVAHCNALLKSIASCGNLFVAISISVVNTTKEFWKIFRDIDVLRDAVRRAAHCPKKYYRGITDHC